MCRGGWVRDCGSIGDNQEKERTRRWWKKGEGETEKRRLIGSECLNCRGFFVASGPLSLLREKWGYVAHEIIDGVLTSNW